MENILSVDVEDYFHPTEVQRSGDLASWDRMPSRVEESTRRTLDLLARYRVRATCFVLGWVAERFPALVRRIAEAGHQIACHSYAHRLVFDMTPEEFRRDTLRARAAIEDACGVRPRAYRAPSYSITRESFWALEILAECGFTHDSSIYPIHHDRYGIPEYSRHAKLEPTPAGAVLEVPVATVRLSGRRVAPVGGGAYLRLLPYRYTAAGLRRLNEDERQPACVYLHPWELDPAQPRIAAGIVARWRTYAGLRGMVAKFDRLLGDFRFNTLEAVHPYPPDTAAPPPDGVAGGC